MSKKGRSAPATSEPIANEPNCKMDVAYNGPDGKVHTQAEGPLSMVQGQLNAIGNTTNGKTLAEALAAGATISISIGCDGNTNGPQGNAPAPTPAQPPTQGATPSR